MAPSTARAGKASGVPSAKAEGDPFRELSKVPGVLEEGVFTVLYG